MICLALAAARDVSGRRRGNEAWDTLAITTKVPAVLRTGKDAGKIVVLVLIFGLLGNPLDNLPKFPISPHIIPNPVQPTSDGQCTSRAFYSQVARIALL